MKNAEREKTNCLLIRHWVYQYGRLQYGHLTRMFSKGVPILISNLKNT